MKTNKWISMFLVMTMIVSLFVPFGPNVHATSTEVITGTVQAFNAAGNSGQIPSEEPDYSYWKTEFVEGNGTPWTTLRFVNKKTGLYLCESDGTLIQTSDKDNAGTNFKLGDWYGSKWVLRTASDKVVGVDANITSIDSGTAVGSDHKSDTIFNGEGYELVRFSDDGSYKTADALTDGSYYVIYTKSSLGDWMNTCLTADPVEAPTETITGTVQAFDAAGNSGQIPAEEPDYSYWKTEFVEGNGTPWTTLRFVNKKTGFYLCESDGTLIQTSDKDNAGTNFKLGDWYGSKWVLRTASDKVVGVDANITSIDSGTAVGSDHKSDTIFNGEGYELVRFSDDGSYKTADALTDGSYYVIYTKSSLGDWMNTCLTADPVSAPPVEEQKFYEAEVISTASEFSWWKFIPAGAEYKIQNVKTGYYLTNKEGTLALTNTADTDNELWRHINNWGVTGHLQNKADDSVITLLGGTTALLASSDFSRQGTQSIRAFDEAGTDYHTTIPAAAADGIPLKICNRDDYDNGRAAYLTATDVEYKEFKDGIAALAGYNLTLGDGVIGLNFYMDVNPEIESADVAMHFTVNGNHQMVNYMDAAEKDGYRVFTCKVPAKEMADKVTAVMYNGSTQGSVYEYSVKEYADKILADETAYTKEIPLVQAMLNYGSYAQSYFGHNTEKPANGGEYLGATELASVTAETLAEYMTQTALGNEDVKLSAASLVLEARTTLRCYFTIGDSVDASTVTYNGNVLKKKGSYYYADVQGILPQNLTENKILTIKYGNGQTVDVTYNCMAYCYNVLNSDGIKETLKDVARALYLYSQAAKIYAAERVEK